MIMINLFLLLFPFASFASAFPPPPPPPIWWNASAADIADLSACSGIANCSNYEAQALVFTLQGTTVAETIHNPSPSDHLLSLPQTGLANRDGPRLLIDTGTLNVDFPASDERWKAHFESAFGFVFEEVPADVCSLVSQFSFAKASGRYGPIADAVAYTSDGWSVHLAMTAAGIHTALPVSASLVKRFPCLASLAIKHTVPSFPSKVLAYQWAIETLLPLAAADIVYNADFYPRSEVPQYMLISADYPIRQKAFIMNIDTCWYMEGQPPCNASQTRETALFSSIVRSRQNLVSVWGWSDPEHAYTNATTHAGGAVFCTFSTSNLAFWAAVGRILHRAPSAAAPRVIARHRWAIGVARRVCRCSGSARTQAQNRTRFTSPLRPTKGTRQEF